MPTKPDDKSKVAEDTSYRKETNRQTPPEHEKSTDPDTARTLGNHPVDPNSLPSKITGLPPGISPEDAVDPGRATPGAPPVDDRSGTRDDRH